mmetsp:Transcript_12852/g.15561  ORF Transcript_12852/g.15561 Transcript_12852/m.15561 type:complete len:316 (-) Transcript_12852:1457-2404(-)|eukprot:CAMPEP_0184037832 /NCGR_PEP_ID=MMETSP0955-20130417/42448_1 /TAXON_ID=627963 /ORGANISM="Aplanochytrium sp, Strain PBS07" /LENGTH=315 /DNA_ID=CAMNT_0026326137 /DNA_START=270 /DNA_END=1217 /DNA_ORIENTATION=-
MWRNIKSTANVSKYATKFKNAKGDNNSFQSSSVSSMNNSTFNQTDGGSPVPTSLDTQKHGWLDVKPFRKNALKSGNWRKKWFMLKNSFLVWYSKRPTADFDIHPSGCMPLGGCNVFQVGLIDGGYGFELTHPHLDGMSLVLKAASLFEAQDWMEAFAECQQGTFENCVYGAAMVTKLKNTDDESNQEIEVTLRRAEHEAKKAVKISEENRQLMESQLDIAESFDEELETIKEKSERLAKIAKKQKHSAHRKHRRIKHAQKRTSAMRDELKEALKSIEILESKILQQSASVRRKLESDLRNLREMIDDKLHSSLYD